MPKTPALLRSLLRTPGFAIAAVLAVALGIAACTLLGSFTHALLVSRLPIPDVDRLQFAISLREGFDPFGTTLYDFTTYTERSRLAESVGTSQNATLNIGGADDPRRVSAARVNNYFETLGVRPVLGRTFNAAEMTPGGPAAVVLGNDLWRARYGAREDIIGTAIDVNGVKHDVIGVMPPGMNLPRETELWAPLPIPDDQAALSSRSNGTILRMKDGVSPEQLLSELRSLNSALQASDPAIYTNWEITAVPFRDILLSDNRGTVRRTLRALAAGVGFLMILAAVNIASLLLARNIAREREIAVRMALGARRWIVTRQLLAESITLAVTGAGIGILMAAWLMPAAARFSPVQADSYAEILNRVALTPAMAAAALAASVLLAIVFGGLPALRASRCRNIAAKLHAGGRTGAASPAALKALRVLVAGEVALAAMLTVCAGLLWQSYRQLQKLELGWDPVGRVYAEIALPQERYPELGNRVAFVDRLLEGVRAIPGVKSADVTTDTPLGFSAWDALVEVEGRPAVPVGELPVTSHRIVTPGYKETLGMEMLGGRFLNGNDRTGQPPVVVISEEFAKSVFPDGSALGKRVRRAVRPGQPAQPWLEIVGIVRNVKEDRSNYRIDRPVWYLSYHQFGNTLPLGLVMRLDGSQAGLGAAIRNTVQRIDPLQPVSSVTPLARHLEGLVVAERFAAILMGALALAGLGLAAVGLFGVISYSVSQRRHDFGIRMALGASPVQLLRVVFRQGLTTASIGLFAGLGGGWIVARMLTNLLHETSPSEPAPYVATLAVLLLVALAACLAPGLRALRSDPTTVLRSE